MHHTKALFAFASTLLRSLRIRGFVLRSLPPASCLSEPGNIVDSQHQDQQPSPKGAVGLASSNLLARSLTRYRSVPRARLVGVPMHRFVSKYKARSKPELNNSLLPAYSVAVAFLPAYL
ncbi:hypothetical protein BDV19DRAFT_46182 [Aspergillus venezuelensis]